MQVGDFGLSDVQQVPVVHQDLPFIRGVRTEDQSEERRLAGSAGSGEKDKLPLADLETDVVEGGPPVIGLGDMIELDHRSEEHTSELQSRLHLVCRLLLEKKKKSKNDIQNTHEEDWTRV